MKTALLSAYQKTDALADFARALQKRGWIIWASSGTKKFLEEKGIEAIDVATMVGEPILGHRVVTLSREIHAGLLARPEDEAELTKLGLQRIDLVYNDLYPLKEEMVRAGATQESIIEKTDIGGTTLLRSAAKGRRIVLCKQSQFEEALEHIDVEWSTSTEDSNHYLARLAAEAESLVADYASASAEFNRRVSAGDFDEVRLR